MTPKRTPAAAVAAATVRNDTGSVAADPVAAVAGTADPAATVPGTADPAAAVPGAADPASATANPARARWEEHYAAGHTPWDTQITPPEVRDFWASGRLPPAGLALDVGCGTGTNVRFLAQHGLHALGFDLAYAAVATGRARTLEQAPHLLSRAHLVQADVTRLPLTAAGAAYILDLGCSHGLPPELRDRYAAGVIANLRPGGYYHLYAFDYVPRPEAEAQDRHMGMHDDEVVTRFTPALEVVEILRAAPDRYPCRWYLLRKP
jgi:SAM-dependent methyltransferase